MPRNSSKSWTIPEPPRLGSLILWLVTFYVLMHATVTLYDQTAQYLPLSDRAGFLPIKKPVLHLVHWKVAFYVHVFSSIFCICAAFTQFVPIRNRFLARVHRLVGKSYVLIVLFVSAPSGLVLALYAEGGWIGRLGFTTLALSWWGATAFGLLRIRNRNVSSHQEWMVRSYALTFSAATLREWQYWFAVLLPPNINTFAIVAWLGWTLNLLVAEIWIRIMRNRKAQRKSSQKAAGTTEVS